MSESELSYDRVDVSDLWIDNDDKKPNFKAQQITNTVKDPATQVSVDRKLEEFLRAHSAYLTPKIAKYLRLRQSGGTLDA